MWRRLNRARTRILAAQGGLLAAAMAFVLVPTTSVPVGLLTALLGGLGFGALVAWQLPAQQVRRQRRIGESADEDVVLEVGDHGLYETRKPAGGDGEGWFNQVPWSAIRWVEATSSHVFLLLSDALAVVVPRDAVGGPEEQASFLADVRTWQARGDGADPLPPRPEGGRDAHVLAYRLVHDDYVLLARIRDAGLLQGRPRTLALMGLLVAAVLVASAEPWRDGLDEGLVVLMVAFAGALVVLGLIPRAAPRVLRRWFVTRQLRRSPVRMPLGPLVLGAGPEGGWLRSETGVVRFGWTQVRRVYSDDSLVVLSFADRVATIVPHRAFSDGPSRQAFVADIERWRKSPARREALVTTVSSQVSSEAHPSTVNPFEPPEGH